MLSTAFVSGLNADRVSIVQRYDVGGRGSTEPSVASRPDAVDIRDSERLTNICP